MMSPKLRVLVPGLLMMTLLAPAAQAPAQAPEKVQRLPIVDQAIVFHGGDLFDHSDTSLTITSASGSFDIRVRRDGGEFDYVVSGKVGRDRIERKVHWNNQVTEQWTDGQPVDLDEAAAQRARDFVNARIYFPFLPYPLNDGNTYKEDLGLEAWHGRPLRKVRVSFEAGTSTDAADQYLYWFDPDTGRMEQFAYSFAVGEGGLRFRKVIAYNRVGGILFSDQENYAVNGHGLSVNQITPEYVDDRMELMSTVTLTNIKVTPID